MSTSKSAPGDSGEAAGLERGGVQSVEIGMKILKVLADAGGSENLGKIATSAGVPPAKAHRYLVSLMRSGFVERDSKNRYVVGPEALRIGLIALARIDVVEVADAELKLLRDKIQGALLLAIWGASGPTIVRWIESTRDVTVNVRAGSNMPLLRSATGQIFAAYLPESIVWPHIDREIDEMKRRKLAAPSPSEVRRRLEKVRTVGLAHTGGEMLPGVLALAAPLFNNQHELVGAIAALGPNGFFDDSIDGENAHELLYTAQAISQRLGALITA
ncbi:IclR family transcriptional regulator [Pseudorhodoplanes sinuspersici]|uniref:Uncharacterized protein n=1 Tax=Pseudorhodoplanes sinuspersici TaxID=1235591 RepID=A0A1W6ZKR6_9HYPH|nr:IclR family transcriptional regulator [Pseudorhodoplanes sinuspersici]ARP98013.1 hypothetical protein CAK95_02150 [Pseudorhodoplanes sinuspersici]RKE68233.1 IclR family transcriptional regulator [Pseudorhodoplanes sinuspersici]